MALKKSHWTYTKTGLTIPTNGLSLTCRGVYTLMNGEGNPDNARERCCAGCHSGFAKSGWSGIPLDLDDIKSRKQALAIDVVGRPMAYVCCVVSSALQDWYLNQLYKQDVHATFVDYELFFKCVRLDGRGRVFAVSPGMPMSLVGTTLF